MDLIRKQLFKWALSYTKCFTSFEFVGIQYCFHHHDKFDHVLEVC